MLFPELKEGDKGIAVVILQAWLSGAGFTRQGFIADGEYGGKTVLAVEILRDYFDLDSESGQFDRAIIEKMKINEPGSEVMPIDFDLFVKFLST